MTDLSKLIDLSGSTILCNDIQVGANTPGGEATAGDVPGLLALTTTNQDQLRFTVKGVNMNSAATDTQIPITLPTGTTTYNIQSCYVWGASHTLTTATAGLFSAAAGGGTAIAADQALTATSGTADTNLNMQTLTLAAAAANTSFTTAKILYFRVGTGEGAAATANATVIINILG